MKSHVLLLACVFEKFMKVSINEIGIIALNCVSAPGYTWQCGLNYTDVKLQTFQDKDMVLLLENIISGRISSVMSDRSVLSDDNKTILYEDAKNLYGHSMSQPLLYDEIKFDKTVKLEVILNIPDDSDIGDFSEVDLKNPDKRKPKTKNFSFAPDNNKNYSWYLYSN